MKKYLLLSAIFLFGLASMAQNVGINATGAHPDPSAMLDISSPNKGILVPRTSTTSRLGIASPAKGLMVYDSTTSSFWFHDGTDWTEIPKGPGGGGVNYFSKKDTNVYLNVAGNLGIGTDTPTEKLTVMTPDYSNGFSHRSMDGKVLSSYMAPTGAGIGTISPTDMFLFANNKRALTIDHATGNIGMGTLPTDARLTLQTDINQGQFGLNHTNGDVSLVTYVGGGTYGGWFGTRSNHSLYFFTNSSPPRMAITNVGNVGVAVENPTNRFQVGGVVGFTGNDIAFGNGTQSTAITQTPTQLIVASNTDISMSPRYGAPGGGFFGIGVTGAPANRFQIGNIVGGFNGNDIAFGNGTQATAIAQTNVALQIATTTDIAFLPQYGTNHGRVGINTGTPQAPLDVANTYSVGPLSPGYSYLYSDELDGDHDIKSFIFSPNPVLNISILTQGNIYTQELDVYSDLRIKNLIGTSAAQKDLAVVKAIRIRDYTMKDKIQYGNKLFKKVIAQELEQVSPDLVSKHTEFIPNVYQLSDSVSKVEGGYCLHFKHEHHLSDTARKLKALLTENGSLQPYDILSIPATNEVVIKTPEIKTNHVFVYGEEVPDFRTVDYEGLTTLNISATQEIERQSSAQAKTIIYQQKEIELLSARLLTLEKAFPRSKNRLAKARSHATHASAKGLPL